MNQSGIGNYFEPAVINPQHIPINQIHQSMPAMQQSMPTMQQPMHPPAKPPAAKKAKTASETYQKLSQLEHVLKRPDTYIGSVEVQQTELWVLQGNSMVHRSVNIVPGFYKIFDEILVNAADNKVNKRGHSAFKLSFRFAIQPWILSKSPSTVKTIPSQSGITAEVYPFKFTRKKAYTSQNSSLVTCSPLQITTTRKKKSLVVATATVPNFATSFQQSLQ